MIRELGSVDWSKQLAGAQDLMRRIGSVDWSKQLTANLEAMRRIGNMDWSEQLAATLEGMRRIGSVNWSKQLAANQEALRVLGGVQQPAPVLSFATAPSREVPSPKPTEKEKAVPKAGKLRRHAPPGWEATPDGRRITSAMEKEKQIPLIILAADIRKSTILMKEARDPYIFASSMGDFVGDAREAIWRQGGIFDKFMGDGFLAYWSFRQNGKAEVLKRVFAAAKSLFEIFHDSTVPLLRQNSQNFPSSVGLSIGLDEGSANIASIADEPTVVGIPVVGAVRMVGASQPWETLANVHLGEYILSTAKAKQLNDIDLELVDRNTKDYQPQQAYAIKFLDLVLAEQE